MLKPAVLLLITTVLICFVSAVPVMANDSDAKREQKAAKIEDKMKTLGVGEQVRLDVKMYDKTRHQGYLRETSDSGFVVVDKAGTAHEVKYTEVGSVKGRNLSTGAKIGIGIAIGAGITLLIVLLIVHAND